MTSNKAIPNEAKKLTLWRLQVEQDDLIKHYGDNIPISVRDAMENVMDVIAEEKAML